MGREPSNIYQQVALAVREAAGSSFVTVGSIDADASRLNVEAIVGLGNLRSIAQSLVGCAPDAWSAPLTDEARAGLWSGRLIEIEGGLYEALFRRFPRGVSDWAQRLLGIQRIYSRGLVDNGRVLACVSIYMRCDRTLDGNETLESAFKWSLETLSSAGSGSTVDGRHESEALNLVA